jgi:chromosome segregation ATPase
LGRRAGLALVVILLTLGGGALAAEPSPAASAAALELLAREVAGMRASLERIAHRLDELSAGQEIDLLLRRIALRERRLETPTAELRRLRGQLASAQEERMQLALYLESLAEEVTRGQLGGEDVAELQDEGEQVEALLEGRLAEIDSIEVRIIPLENEIAEAREEIEILEEILDERLELP